MKNKSILTPHYLKIYASVFLIAVLLFSCRKDNTLSLEVLKKPDQNYLTSQVVLKTSESLLKAESEKLSSSNKLNSNQFKIVKSIKAYKAKDNLNAFYILNYKDGGFAILSADRRTPFVLAYSENNNFDTEAELPSGLQDWMEMIKSNVYEIRTKNIEYTGQDDILINRLQKIDNLNGKEVNLTTGKVTAKGKVSVIQPEEPPFVCEEYLTYKGPLLQTTWGQGSGYNNSYDYVTGVGTLNGKAWTGCLATAMGQVVKYHQYPNTYNYSIMPTKATYANEFDAGTNEMSNMLYAAAQGMGMSYSSSSSSSNVPKLINCFKNNFNYSNSIHSISITSSNQQLSVLQQQIDNNWPVIMTGARGSNASEGHAWVIDGYQLYYHCINNQYAVYISFHMNWGWDEQYSNTNYVGYYVLSYMNPRNEPVPYNTDLTAIINIHP